MARIVATANTTLDGYMEGPNGEGDLGWLMPFVDDGIADNGELLARARSILLGRITYEGFSQFWPTQEGDFADLMNKPPKLVFTRGGSLTEASWGKYANAELVDGDAEQRLRALKAEDDGDLLILASGGLVSSLLPLGLVDELQLVVVPVVLGGGKPYLRDVRGPVALELADVKQYPKGSARLTYRAKR